jgi:hypothetical protein
MTEVKGIYKIPSIKTVFLIISVFPAFSDSSQLSQESKKRTEYIERILRSKDRKIPKETQQWKLKVVTEHDFLQAITRCMPKGLVSSNQSFDNHITLEQLTINLLKTSESLLDCTCTTPKYIGVISQEDIIEVFI